MTGWIDLAKVIEVVEQSKTGKWLWPFNSRCKYINVRIDMRDGHCVIRDRHNNPITLDQLEYQITSEDKS